MTKSRLTPNWINNLEEGEVFVFGSNLQGYSHKRRYKKTYTSHKVL